MAKKKKAEDGADEGEKKKRSPLVIIGLCVVLAGVGYMLGGRKAGAAEGAAAVTTTTIVQLEGCTEGIDAATAEHKTVDLPAMNINLTDGHYLRVTVSLGLCPDVVLVEGSEFESAPAQDLIVSTLSGNSMTVLADPAGREQVKELLTKKIASAYPDEVHEIYFLEFVMQ
ncbi:MAG: flagellar basal body-associated FliL family protein [Ilumatobacteraceae bacterium]